MAALFQTELAVAGEQAHDISNFTEFVIITTSEQLSLNIPGSSLVCNGHVNCSLCNTQIWVSCQPEGHVVLIQQTKDGVTKQISATLRWDDAENGAESSNDACTRQGEFSVLKAEVTPEDSKEVEKLDLEAEKESVALNENVGQDNCATENTAQVIRVSTEKKEQEIMEDETVLKSLLNGQTLSSIRFSPRKETKLISPLKTKLETDLMMIPYKNPGSRNRRLNIQSGNVKAPSYHCELCNKTLRGKPGFVEHVKGHVIPKQHSCDICQQAFRFACEVKRHKMLVHEGWKPFRCDICGKSFGKKATLDTHRNSHMGNKPFVCELCGKGFTWESNLCRHMKGHTGEKRFSCEFCGKRFSQKITLLCHRHVHTGEEPYCCEVCGRGFRNLSNLRTHQVVMHGRKRKSLQNFQINREQGSSDETPSNNCEICGKTYVSKTSLNTHKKIVHSGIRPYPCEVCGRKFPTPQRLEGHRHTHTGKKPYACSTCNMRFNNQANKNRHEKLHSDKNIYKCPICGKGFGQKSYVGTHLKTHSKKQGTLTL